MNTVSRSRLQTLSVRSDGESKQPIGTNPGKATLIGELMRKSAGAVSARNPVATFSEATSGVASEVPYRSEMEKAFGTDFSGVKAHLGQTGAMSELGAHAVAAGEQIAFGSAHPDRRLVAHELTHVMQARNSGVGGMSAKSIVSEPGDAAELEADAVADRVAAGESVHVESQPIEGGTLFGSWLDDAAEVAGDVTGTRENEALLDFMEETYEEMDYRPTTGSGRFDAAYDPHAGSLQISVSIYFSFQNGNPNDPAFRAKYSIPPDAQLYQSAFNWTEAEKQSWQANAIEQVRTAWSEQYTFHTTSQELVGVPDVHVAVNVLPAASPASCHYYMAITKWPLPDAVRDSVSKETHEVLDSNQVTMGESANPGTGEAIASPDVDSHSKDISDNPAYAALAEKNPCQIFFGQNSHEVLPDDVSALEEFKAALEQPGMPAFPIEVYGHAGIDEGLEGACDEEAQFELSALRADAVAALLPNVLGGGNMGSDEADDSSAWRRVDIEIGAVEATQTTLLHEVGHMLGLGDEYVDSDAGRDPGEPVAHSEQVAELMPENAEVVACDSDSIMSIGQEVQPHHYVTFMEVLGVMTGTTGQWALGAGTGTTPEANSATAAPETVETTSAPQ